MPGSRGWDYTVAGWPGYESAAPIPGADSARSGPPSAMPNSRPAPRGLVRSCASRIRPRLANFASSMPNLHGKRSRGVSSAGATGDVSGGSLRIIDYAVSLARERCRATRRTVLPEGGGAMRRTKRWGRTLVVFRTGGVR